MKQHPVHLEAVRRAAIRSTQASAKLECRTVPASYVRTERVERFLTDRLALTNVLEYREQRRREQYASIEALSVDVDESTDINATLNDVKAARKTVAAKRRNDGRRGNELGSGPHQN